MSRIEPRWITIEDLFEQTYCSIDFGAVNSYDSAGEFWECMIADKGTDDGFDNLVRSMAANGHHPDGAIGFDDGRITEGHHRIVAAILLCFDGLWYTPEGRTIRDRPKWDKSKTPDSGRYSWISAH